MSDLLSFAEIDGQHVELLPARTVLSMFVTGGAPKGGDGGAAGGAAGAAAPGASNYGGDGGDAKGKAAFFDNWFYSEGDVYVYVTGSAGGAGGAATSAPAGGAPAGGAPSGS